MLTPARPKNPPRTSPWPTGLRRAAGPALAAALAAGAMLLGPAPASAQQPAPPKVAVIDLRRAIAETEQGLRVQATLKKLFDSRQAELEVKTRALQAEKDALDKELQGGKTPKEILQKKYEKLVLQNQELEKATLEAQREMQRKEQEMTAPIVQGVIEAVKRIAAQEGFEMVLEKSAVPYFRGDLEITDRAIQMYNGGQATPKGAPPPGKAPAAPPAPAPAPKPAAPAPGPAAPKK